MNILQNLLKVMDLTRRLETSHKWKENKKLQKLYIFGPIYKKKLFRIDKSFTHTKKVR